MFWLLYLLHHPQYLEEAYNEIQLLIGINKYPKLEDRSSLPKVMSIIQEALRFSGTLGLPQKLTKNSSLAGNPIPKGTDVILKFYYNRFCYSIKLITIINFTPSPIILLKNI